MRRPKRVSCALLICILHLSQPPQAEAADFRLLVLLSSDDESYETTAASIASHVRNAVPDTNLRQIVLGKEPLPDAPMDAVVALGGRASSAAQAMPASPPVISALARLPWAVAPRPDFTGVALDHGFDEQLKVLQQVLPDRRRVAVLFTPSSNPGRRQSMRKIATANDLELIERPVEHARDISRALKNLDRQADVLWVLPDEVMLAPAAAKSLLIYAFRNRLPLVGLSPNWVKAGALYAVGWDYADLGRQVGDMVLAVHGGTPPNEIPIQTPRLMDLVINRRAAEHLRMGLEPLVATLDARVIQ